MKAMKPIFRTKQYIKYGFVKMEHEYCCCPKCRKHIKCRSELSARILRQMRTGT